MSHLERESAKKLLQVQRLIVQVQDLTKDLLQEESAKEDFVFVVHGFNHFEKKSEIYGVFLTYQKAQERMDSCKRLLRKDVSWTFQASKIPISF